jgi:flagellar motor switch/type III secretory pathway protein FliN
MHPLLSREEINALLNETEKPSRIPPRQLVIDLDKQCIILHNFFDLQQFSLIELNLTLNTPYLIRAKDEAIACGQLIIVEGKLILKVVNLIDSNNCNIVE